MASYGFERVSSDDDLEEPRKEKRPSTSPFNLSSSSYPATSRKGRREGGFSKKPKPHEMKMVELKRNEREHEAEDLRGGTAAWHQQQSHFNNQNNDHNYAYDQQSHYARPMESDAGQYRGPVDFMEAATNAAAALGGQIRKMTAVTQPRRDYLYEAHGNERDHLLVPPTSPRYRPHSPSLAPPSSSAPSQSSTTTFATFTTTTTSGTYSGTYSSSSSSSTFYSSSSALYDTSLPPLSSSSPSSPSSFVSLASSPTMLLPPPPLKNKNKKRVTWVDESMVGTQLEEVIEVERYLKQRGSLGWWAELVWDNKSYFLLLLFIALLFLASVTFILYKLVF